MDFGGVLNNQQAIFAEEVALKDSLDQSFEAIGFYIIRRIGKDDIVLAQTAV